MKRLNPGIGAGPRRKTGGAKLVEILELVERCRRGDALAWEALVRRLQSQVYGLACHYIRDPEEARDLAQEIFLRIYERIRTFEGGNFTAWMMRLARNLCIDRLRRRNARPPASDVDLGSGLELPAGGPDPEQSWINDSRKQLVYRAMGRLSEQHREVILLKEIQGLELQEIADLLHTPLGTVKSRSNRARVELARRVLALDPALGG